MEKKTAQQVLVQLEELQGYHIPFVKNDRSLNDLLQGEIAYGLLYENIRPNYIKECYRLLGIEYEPNILCLIQVDDFYEHCSRLPASRGYHLKDGILKCIRNKM